jgi:hypothetical protein
MLRTPALARAAIVGQTRRVTPRADGTQNSPKRLRDHLRRDTASVTQQQSAANPKKHHFVPQFVLRRFADEHQQLIVHRLDRETFYRARVVDVGHRNHGHTLYWPNRPANQESLEKQMAVIEADASRVIADLDSGRSLGDAEREVLAFFMALMWRRNRWILAAVREQVLGGHQPADPADRKWANASMGLLASITPMVAAYAARDDPHARPKERWDNVVAELLQLDWRLRQFRTPALLISDTPVCLSGIVDAGTLEVPEVWTQHGIGVGFGNCLRVTMPLSPTLALTVHRERVPDRFSADRMNRLTVYGSREFIAHHPGWAQQHPRHAQQLPELLFKQRFLRRAMGPTS